MASAAKQAGVVLGLVVAAYVLNGLYVYWDARTNPPAHAPSPKKVAAPAPASPTAPWAENYERLRRGEYAVLVDNAWAAPEKGSLSMAARALAQCAMFMDPESLERILDKINAAPPQERDLRLKALEALRTPCRSLEGRPELLPLGPYMHRLYEAARGGPYDQMLEGLFPRHPVPRQVREERMRALMATNDPLAMTHVVGSLTQPNATFEGEQIPWVYRGAYLTAWHQVMCANYDECYGPERRQGLLDCVNHGSCPPISPEVLYRIFFPTILFGDRSDEYYRRIQAHLDRRRYDAFGLP